jgi:hypothetical protein
LAIMKKNFIGIETVIADNRLVAITLSDGGGVFCETGISSLTAIEFLFNLVHKRKDDNYVKDGVVFVCYAFSRSNEFIFSGLPSNLRDKVFQSYPIRHRIDELESDQESIDDILYSVDKDSQEYEQADFERHVNKHALAELKEIEYEGYKLSLLNGKSLTIRKGGKAVSIYDIYGFFKGDSFNTVLSDWFDSTTAILGNATTYSDYGNTLEFHRLSKRVAHSIVRSGIIARLADKVNNELSEYGINLTRYHGAGSIAGYWLAKMKAKTFFHNYRYKRQLAPELHKAINQAYYGGRAEQFKIGTLYDVKVYDINSAYANAIRYLPTLLHKPKFSKEWTPEPFSVWFIEYDFSTSDCYFGLLPNRDLANYTKYKLKGAGYFWQPEIVYLIQNHPKCINIKHGFVYDYDSTPFDDEINKLYELRKQLQDNKNPLERVVKLSLSGMYGKFCQAQGKGHYYNLSYAGFITSFTRAQLLNATRRFPVSTISFQTDAIHSTEFLDIPVSDELGEYKLKEYAKVTYLDNGVYQCYDKAGNVVKTKTRGFRGFDFQKALADISGCRSFAGLVDIFIGHNLHQENLFRGAAYLSQHALSKNVSPLENRPDSMRWFENKEIDLTRGYIDSKVNGKFTGRESASYQRVIYKGTDLAIDQLVR